jgi:putative aldouronate transport system substrate-binding protein
MPANTAGLMQNSYWSEILARDVGVQLNIRAAGGDSETIMNMLLAADDLPDVVVFEDASWSLRAVEANQLIRLCDHQEELWAPFYFFPESIQFTRDHVSAGSGFVYSINQDIRPLPRTSGRTDFGPHLRWDVWRAIGAPELDTWEDLLPVLRAMQDYHPTNEYGQPVYAVSWWTDWDGCTVAPAIDFASYHGHRQRSFAEINLLTHEVTSIFDDDSLYRRWLHFMFSANQMGMLDPDSLTQSYHDARAKKSTGRTLFTFWYWFGPFNNPERDARGEFFLPVFINDSQINRGTEAYFTGHRWRGGIGRNTQNLEAALRFLNYTWTPEGNWAMEFGDQGYFWDMNENGPFVTEFGWTMVNDPEVTFANGGRIGDGANLLNWRGYSGFLPHPHVMGFTRDFRTWQRTEFIPEPPRRQVEWEEFTGMDYLNFIPTLRERGQLVEGPYAPMAPFPEDIDMIRQAAGNNWVAPQSWVIIMANDQAEFDMLWDEMVAGAYGRGAQQVIDNVRESWNAAEIGGSNYMR